MTEEMKYREFWIDHDEWYSKEEKEFNDRTCSKDEWDCTNLVHVIEYSAFAGLQAEVERLNDENKIFIGVALVAGFFIGYAFTLFTLLEPL